MLPAPGASTAPIPPMTRPIPFRLRAASALLHPLLSLALAAATARAADTGSIRGRVVDRTTRQPIAQATVAVLGTPLGALTGDDGGFEIARVRAGTHRVRALRMDYPPVVLSDVVVTAGRTTQADFELDVAAVKAGEVEVRAKGFAKPADVPTTSYALSYEEIRRSPGAIGDVLRLVQSLPGLAMANDQRNDLIARGGSPNENLTLVDNVEFPTLNHFAAQGTSGGPISMLDNELVRDATFLAGGFPAAYGGRLSSVLEVRLRDGDRERFRSETVVSVAGAGALAEGPLGSRGAWIGSVRRSYLDLLADSFGLAAIPHYTNWQLRGSLEPGPRDRVWFVAVGGRDDIALEPDPADLDDPNEDRITDRGWRQIEGVNWQHLLGARGWTTLGVSDAVGIYEVEAFSKELGGARSFRNASLEGETTVKLDAAYRSPRFGDWKAGARLQRTRNHFAVEQPFGTQNPFSSDTARVNEIALDLESGEWNPAAHAQATWRLGARADATLGVRADRFGAIAATTLDPRAGLTLHLTPAWDVNFSAGRFHQSPPLALVEAYDVNRRLDPIRADHLVAGLQFLPRPDLRFTLETYAKTYARYPVSRDYPTLSFANTGDTYALYGLLLPLASAGSGRARGVEFYAQKKLTGRWYGQLSYAYSHVEHRALDGVLRRGAFDSPHNATAILGWIPTPDWELSGRFSAATGRPYTPPLEPVSTQQNRYVLDLARVNGVRARDYRRLDLRVDRRTRTFGANVTWFFEAQNVLDERNVFQYVWNAKTRSLAAVEQIHFFPVGGVTIAF